VAKWIFLKVGENLGPETSPTKTKAGGRRAQTSTGRYAGASSTISHHHSAISRFCLFEGLKNCKFLVVSTRSFQFFRLERSNPVANSHHLTTPLCPALPNTKVYFPTPPQTLSSFSDNGLLILNHLYCVQNMQKALVCQKLTRIPDPQAFYYVDHRRTLMSHKSFCAT